MKGFMSRDGGGVRRRRFLADRESDASGPERERLAAGAGPRRDGHLDAIPGPPGSAYPERIAQQPRGICQCFYDGVRDGGREPALPRDEAHRGPIVEPDDEEPSTAQCRICAQGLRCAVDPHR